MSVSNNRDTSISREANIMRDASSNGDASMSRDTIKSRYDSKYWNTCKSTESSNRGPQTSAGRPATVGLQARRWLHSNYLGFGKKNIFHFCEKEETLNFVI
jgi:hypothetical protein